MSDDSPHGFVLSEAALYSFKCQDVYPDILAFASAIPQHLRPLFLIPIQLERASVASRIARSHYGDCCSIPTGDTPEADLFADKTFVSYQDESDNSPAPEGGSIFEQAGPIHQENNLDENVQSPTDTSYMSDVDMTQYGDYPYRSKEKVRHSSVGAGSVVIARIRRLALKPEALLPRTPEKIKRNAEKCSVTLVSYDPKTRVYTFGVDAGNGSKTVQASLSEVDEIALSCNCPFWRYNGPEFHAKENSFMLGQPFGTADVPNVRDPDRKFWLCKHAYSVLRRLEDFVQEVTEENWDLDDDHLLKQIDSQWDRLEGTAEVPQEELSGDDVDIDVEWDEAQAPEADAPEADAPDPDAPEAQAVEPDSVEVPAAPSAIEPEPAGPEEPEDYSGEAEEPDFDIDVEEPEDYSGDEEREEPEAPAGDEEEEREEPDFDIDVEEPEDYSGDEEPEPHPKR